MVDVRGLRLYFDRGKYLFFSMASCAQKVVNRNCSTVCAVKLQGQVCDFLTHGVSTPSSTAKVAYLLL